MRRSVSCLIVIALLVSIFVPVQASNYNDFLGVDESKYDMELYYAALWNNYNSNMYGRLWEYVCGEEYYAYTQAVKKVGNDGWVQFLSSLTEQELTKERYVEILVNLMAMLDYNTTDLINGQVEADTLKTFGDYVVDVTGILAQTISLHSAFGSKVTKPMKRIAIALDLSWGGTEFTIDSIETFKHLDRVLKQYDNHNRFLNAIVVNASDEALKNAARELQSIVDKAFFCKIHAVTEVSGDFSKYLGGTVLLDTVVMEYMLEDASILGLSRSAIETIGVLKSAYDYLKLLPLATDLATFAGDMLLGASDVLNRYNEMRALVEIRTALIKQMKTERAAINSAQKLQEIDNLCGLMKNLIYVNYRGEYCLHEMLTKDAQAYSLVIKINGKAQSVDKVFEIAQENTRSFIECVEYFIFPILSVYQINEQVDYSTYINTLQSIPSDNEYSECLLYDIDGNGIQELIVMYVTDFDNGYGKFSHMVCEVYTLNNGKVVQCMDMVPMYALAGGPSGSVNIVDIDGVEYLAITSEGGETGGYPTNHRAGEWYLYQIDGTKAQKSIDVTYDYTMYVEYGDVLLYDESSAKINGKKVSYREYERWRNGLKILKTMDGFTDDWGGEDDGVSINRMIEQLKN